MGADLAAALCLLLVFEGLFLFAAPGIWKRMAEQMQQIDPKHLRMIGGAMVLVGIVALKIVR